MHCDGLDVLLSLHIFVVEQICWQVELACVDCALGDNSRHQIEGVDSSVLVEQSLDVLLDEASVVVALMEDSIVENALQELEVVVKSDNPIILQGLFHQLDSLVTSLSVGDELGNHGIVECRNDILVPHSSLNPHSFMGDRLSQVFELSIAWEEVVERILSIDAHLNGVSLLIDFRLLLGQREAAGHKQLPFHKIIARDHFRDGVLDLKTSVHLHEVVPVGV